MRTCLLRSGGIGILTHSALAKGLQTGKWRGATPLRMMTSALVGAKNPAQVQGPLGAVVVTLADDEAEAIKAALAAAPNVPPAPRR